MNVVLLSGRLGKDAEYRKFENGNAVVRINLATSESYKDGEEWKQKTEWHIVVIWGYRADRAKYYKKGDLITIKGKIKTRTYQDQSGVEKSITEIYADDVTDTIKLSNEPPMPSEVDSPYSGAGGNKDVKTSSEQLDEFNKELDAIGGGAPF